MMCLTNIEHPELTGANGTEIPYSGWVVLEYKLMFGVYVKNNFMIVLLFLVSPSEEVNCAILGFNVIEKILNSVDINDKQIAELLLRMMKSGNNV